MFVTMPILRAGATKQFRDEGFLVTAPFPRDKQLGLRRRAEKAASGREQSSVEMLKTKNLPVTPNQE